MELRFNYKYPTPYLVDPPKSYTCAYDSMTYLVTTPDGRRRALSLTDKKKTTGYATAAFFNLGDYKSFDAVGRGPGLMGERRYFWKKNAPSFQAAGEYRIVETGTFHDSEGLLPDLPYQSTEAICIVDPHVPSIADFKTKAQERLSHQLAGVPSVNWMVRELAPDHRVVVGTVGRATIPEDQVPIERRRKGWEYGGMKYTLTFKSDGEFVSEAKEPTYWISD